MLAFTASSAFCCSSEFRPDRFDFFGVAPPQHIVLAIAEGRAVVFLVAGRAVLDLTVDAERAACLLECFQRVAARVVVGIDQFGRQPVGELGLRLDFQLVEEHVARRGRLIAP